MVSGSKSQETEVREFKKRIGFVQASIELVAPSSNADIKEAGYPVWKEEEEPDYVGEKDVELTNSEGKVIFNESEVKFVRIPFYLKDVKTNEVISRPKIFYVWDYEVVSKNNPDNLQWINEQGNTTYAKSKEDLKDWFTMNGQLAVRRAKKGEKELYEFLRAAYNLKWNDRENIAKILVNVKDLLKGKFKELQQDVEATAGTVIVALTVRQKTYTDEDSGEEKTRDIEDIYNAFAPGNDYKFLQTKKEFTQKDADAIRKKDESNKTKTGRDKEYISNLERVILAMTDPSYGCRDTYYLGLAKEYNKEDYAITSTDKGMVTIPSMDGDDY